MSNESPKKTIFPSNIPQMEINISNVNSNGQIVLNDVLLMELLCRYHFLISWQETDKDEDYGSWGWSQVTKSFNESYEGVELSTPFSLDELKWRWSQLSPVIGALSKAKGQIPDSLWQVMGNVHNRITKEKEPAVPKTECQEFLLSQLHTLQSLSQLERRRLEVEVLDLILQQDHLENATHNLGPKEEEAAQSEYNEFLKAIRVKELPADTLERLAMDGFCITPHTNKMLGINNQNNTLSSTIVSNGSIDLVEIKSEPTDETESAAKSNTEKIENLRYVPLKSAKHYIKKLRIRLKRLDFDEILPLAIIRRSSRSSLKP
ncbi:uncharacterized protein LOC108112534 [Drosophila eugracilis]|uniref:uncharacterized protein LOC108112534 n=1 Tax=Drosophila eugracilis TaxID=29029 RepID=UPI0007E6CE7E|nr:uncharacterized protein LOC108112534 [Drosophila eugracilis]